MRKDKRFYSSADRLVKYGFKIIIPGNTKPAIMHTNSKLSPKMVKNHTKAPIPKYAAMNLIVTASYLYLHLSGKTFTMSVWFKLHILKKILHLKCLHFLHLFMSINYKPLAHYTGKTAGEAIC